MYRPTCQIRRNRNSRDGRRSESGAYWRSRRGGILSVHQLREMNEIHDRLLVNGIPDLAAGKRAKSALLEEFRATPMRCCLHSVLLAGS